MHFGGRIPRPDQRRRVAGGCSKGATLAAIARRGVELDRGVAEFASGRGPRSLHRSLARLSTAANRSRIWMVVAGVLAASGRRRGRRAAIRGVLSLATASALSNLVLKPLLPRARPHVVPGAPELVKRPVSSSFPSGHAASAAAFATAVALEAPPLTVPIAAAAAAVAYSRISTGVHYPSDVLGGIAVGVGSAALTTRVWPMIDTEPAEAPRSMRSSSTEPAPAGAGFILVANAASGSETQEDTLNLIRSRLPECDIRLVEDPESLPRVARQAASEATALGVLGGDGTIGTVAAEALREDLPLGVFPSGTLNHFARDLGIEDIEQTCDAVARGELVDVDAASIDGRTFVNTASFGTYPEFVERRERHEKRLGKWPAAMLSALSLLRSNDSIDVRINGEPVKVLMIFIGNCSYEPPGFAPLTRSDMNDGQLDCRYLRDDGSGTALRLAAALITGRLERINQYTRFCSERITVESGRDELSLAADGETFPGSGSFEVRKLEGPLRVFKAR